MSMRTKAMHQVDALRNEVEALRASLTSMLEGALHRVVDEIDSARREGQAAVERQLRPAFDDMRQALTLRDMELIDVLKSISHSQQRIADQLEADRSERVYLRDVLGLVADRLVDARATGSSIIGGTVRPDLAPAHSVSLTAAEDSEDAELRLAVEVRCRFGDRWADGFEVADVVDDDHGRRYRVRRISDGHIIPTSFEERDIRLAIHDR